MVFSFLERRRQSGEESRARNETPSKRVSTAAGNRWGDSLWDYSVKVYSLDSIERTCLRLQDEYHANVDIILWCCWLDHERIHLSKDALDDVLISIDTVNQSTLLKLRSVRRHIKQAGAFTRNQSKVIDKQLLNAELMIEKVLLFRLQDLTRRFLDVMRDARDPLDLFYYFDFLGIADAKHLADSILDTCRQRNGKVELV